MSPEVINLIQTISLDAIKILGPATVAAYAAYKAASIQLEVKLRELEKSHQFQARESIFAHLKDRLAHIDQQTDKLNADMGHMLGFATGFHGSAPSTTSTEFVALMTSAMQSIARLTPLEITVLLDDMRMSGLTSSQEFKTLSDRGEINLQLAGPPSYEQLKVNVLELLETYNLLGICTRLLLQKQMERVFSPYLPSEKSARL
jgi:hypothetical protein